MNENESNIDNLININVNYLLTCLFILIEIVGVLGNVLVIISVNIDSHMKGSLTNRLIVQIACCDLIILLLNIPDLIQFVSSINGNWILNEIFCKLIRSILVLVQYSSVLTMCIVTIERFIGIVYPLRSKFLSKKKHLKQITFFVWIFSLICTSPNIIYLHVISTSSSRRSCSLVYSTNRFKQKNGYILHKSIESTIFYFLPLLLQIYCYIKIAKQLFHIDETLRSTFILYKKQNISQKQNNNNNINDDEEDFIVNENNSLSILKSNEEIKVKITYKTLKSRRSVIKMLIVVVLIYFISFSPQVLVFLLFHTNAIQSTPKFIQTPYFIAFTMLLVTISSASNPIVYAIFSSKFRQSFAKLIRYLCFCSNRSTFHYNSNQTTRSIQETSKGKYFHH